jgi:hexosaminidase
MFDPIVTTQLNTKGEWILLMEGEVEGMEIYYSMDDAMPDNYSNKYTAPFVLPEDVAVLRVISYRNGKPLGKMLSIPMESLKKRATKVL